MARHILALLALSALACGKTAPNTATTRTNGGPDASAGADSAVPPPGPEAATEASVDALPKIDADVGDCNGGQPFADPLVEAAVRNEVGKPSGPMTSEDLAGVRFLVAGVGATTLAGVECLTSLEVLGATGGTVSDLSPLQDLEHLTSVSLQYNQIESLLPLSGHPLRTVTANDNNIESLDGLVLPQGSCNHLLNMHHNPIDHADVERFCNLDWVVTWGAEGDAGTEQCNATCL